LNNQYLDPAEKELLRAMRMLGNGRAEEAKVIVEGVLVARPESVLAYRSKAMLQVHGEDFNGGGIPVARDSTVACSESKLLLRTG
jgi:hypothetical protein